jgi:hypothetical protein
VAGLLLIVAVTYVALFSKPTGPLARVPLADGRILEIEGLSYGREHRMGQSTFLADHFGYWLPWKMERRIRPLRPEAKLTFDEPRLVVWVDALDPTSGKFVDCQGLDIEFVDEKGDSFPSRNREWFGGDKFWREGHSFAAFPRDMRKLHVQIRPWTTNVISHVDLPNAFFRPAERWEGNPLPQRTNCDGLEITLTALHMRTNKTSSRYWEPAWELHGSSGLAIGWNTPEWTAKDALGNEGQFLGVHQPVLRFEAVVYPAATNRESAVPIPILPAIVVTNLMTNIVWWNKKCRAEFVDIEAIGFFPIGTCTFCEGKCLTNSTAGLGVGPIRGGASRWVRRSKRENPFRVDEWAIHYASDPVIYVRAPVLKSPNRLAVRLQDDKGREWIAKPEPQGAFQGIYPFLVKLPKDVETAQAEIVLLKPVRASFIVDRGAPGAVSHGAP